MKVKVQLFARARELAGHESVEIALPEQVTIGELRELLGEKVPALLSLKSSLLFAVNQSYASDDDVVPLDADVAAFPPVSGG